VVTSRTIRSSDCRVMPWRNGRGSTTELAVEPPGATLEAFDWRISVAELQGPGPFSSFPGCDRVIVQLDGPPMTLAHTDGEPVELVKLTPHAFSGDGETTCSVAGVAHDFNLIVRRGLAESHVSVAELGAGELLDHPDDAATVLHVLRGRLVGCDGYRLTQGDTRVAAPGKADALRAETVALAIVCALRAAP
jgi:uncharacterized protein